MRKKKTMKKKPLYNSVLLFVSFFVTVLCLLSGSYINEGYDIEVGKVSPKRFVAPRDIENKVATERKIEEALNSVTPFYTLDATVGQVMADNLDTFFKHLEERIIEANRLEREADNQEPVGEISGAAEDGPEEQIVATPIIITENQFEYYRTLSRTERREFEETVAEIAQSVLEQGLRDEADTKTLLYIRDEFNKKQWEDDLRNLGYTIVTAVIEPNLIVDEVATEEIKARKASEVEPVIIVRDLKIVDENEIITEEIYAVLESLNLINEPEKNNVLPHIGAFVILLLLFLAISLFLSGYYKKILRSKKETTVLFVLYILAILLVRVMNGVPFYIIPLTIVTMLVSILLDQKLSIVFNLFVVTIGVLVYSGEFDFALFFLITGTISAILTKLTFERNKIVLVGVFMGIIGGASAFSILLFFEKSFSNELLFYLVMALANGFLSLIIALGSLPVWEAVFDIITPIKLIDLTNPNNILLRRLTIEAPGTYHHSLIVANLAETAAYDIDANAALARVGGYYHDIGKLKYPFYYSENQSGENPHDKMDPYSSLDIIKQHVAYGLELADSYGLPKIIKDVIIQHHGTTLVSYFYMKAMEAYSEEHVNEQDFRYSGIIPQTKEYAIIMLADTVEAAVRSMMSSSKSMDEIEEFIKKLIRSKLDDSQLDESSLTIKELETIRKSFVKVFKGMYHQRVKYPEKNKAKEADGLVSKKNAGKLPEHKGEKESDRGHR